MKEVTIKVSIQSNEAKTDGISFSAENTLFFPSGMDLCKHIGQNPSHMAELYFHLLQLSLAKGVTYGNDWAADGPLFSMMPNVLRKIRRMKAGLEQKVPEALIDGGGDAINYIALFMDWMRVTYPDKFHEWLNDEVVAYIDKYCSIAAVQAKESKS